MSRNNWFEIDKAGLAKVLARRGHEFVVHELVSNAWDEDPSFVSVTIRHEGRQAFVKVEDNSPEGFRRLSDAWTLFAESYKKNDATKRGRYDLGEKLVLALASSAVIETTTGTVVFAPTGSRHVNKPEAKRDVGSSVELYITCKRLDTQRMIEAAKRVITPPGIDYHVNDEQVLPRKAVESFEVALPTEIADEEGSLRPTSRKTFVAVYEPRLGETGTIYEMGIPVVETGDDYHVNVFQRVPLGLDKDNVTPGYLRKLRSAVLNATADLIDSEQSGHNWVSDALTDPNVEPEAIGEVMTQRYGTKRVTYDPSDPEANKIATSQGYAVVHGGAFDSSAWANIKAADAIRPAGKVTPSPKTGLSEDGTGRPLKTVSRDDWTEGMDFVYRMTQRIAAVVLPQDTILRMTVANDAGMTCGACYGQSEITFNLFRLGHVFFDNAMIEPVDAVDLIIHELGHHACSDHLSRDYYKALTRIGAKLALVEPKQIVPKVAQKAGA